MKTVYVIFCCLVLCGLLYAEGDPWVNVTHHQGSSLDEWGPDAFGYVAKSDTNQGGPTPLWTDIRPYGTEVFGLDDDNFVGPFPIGFTFHYYWYDVHQFWVGSNGYIKFSSRGQIFGAYPEFPNPAPPNDVVGVLASDWTFAQPYNSRCYYWSNNSDTLIVMFLNTQHYASGGSFSFEIILARTDSSLTFQYGTRSGGLTNNCRVGIENVTGAAGLNVLSYMPAANSAIRFAYPHPSSYAVHDLAVAAVQNPLSGGMFLRRGDSLLPWVQVTNFGTQTETACSLHFAIRRPDGTLTLQRDTLLQTAIEPLDTLPIIWPVPWADSLADTLIASATVQLAGDSVAANNSLSTEVHVVNLPGQLAYDDDNWDCLIGWDTENRATAMEFVPPEYPVIISDIGIFVTNSSPSEMDGVIYADDGPGRSPGTELWRRHFDHTNFGWDTSAVLDRVIIRSGSFFVACWALDVGIGCDTTSARGISRRAWEYLNGWGQFKWWNTGNFMIRCTVAPWNGNHAPGAFERTVPADTLIPQWRDGILCGWTASPDADNDTVRYIFHIESDNEYWPHLVPRDTVTVGTQVLVRIYLPVNPLDVIVNFRWTVRATDGIDTTDASNGEGHFTADIPAHAEDPNGLLPEEFALHTYPNPFNSTAMIGYDIPTASPVELTVYNLVGEVVQVLHQGDRTPGRYRAEWNALSQPSGTYFAVLKAGNTTKIQKLLLLK